MPECAARGCWRSPSRGPAPAALATLQTAVREEAALPRDEALALLATLAATEPPAVAVDDLTLLRGTAALQARLGAVDDAAATLAAAARLVATMDGRQAFAPDRVQHLCAIALAQARIGRREAAAATFARAGAVARERADSIRAEHELVALAGAQIAAGFREAAFATTMELARHPPGDLAAVVGVIAAAGNRAALSRLVRLCADDLGAAYAMSALLAQTHPAQANAVARVVLRAQPRA